MTNPYDTIVERLTVLEAELSDLAYSRLRELARDPDGSGAAAAKAEERRLLQARRAIAKAIGALSERAVVSDDE